MRTDPRWTIDEAGRVRVRIVEAAGTALPGGLMAADPPAAQPHFEKLGWCIDAPCEALGGRGNPKITLDDGSVLWGYQCWWEPV